MQCKFLLTRTGSPFDFTFFSVMSLPGRNGPAQEFAFRCHSFIEMMNKRKRPVLCYETLAGLKHLDVKTIGMK